MGSIFDKHKVLHGLPLPGQTITYSRPSKWAWFTNVLENEKKLLELGKTYTVEKTELNSSSTYVWLEEFPDLEDRTFFSMEAFDWDTPELELKNLVGLTSYDMDAVKRTYGYGFKDIHWKVLIEGDPYIVIKCDESRRIIEAWFETDQYDKLVAKWGPILIPKVNSSSTVMPILLEAQEAPYDHIAKIKALNNVEL